MPGKLETFQGRYFCFLPIILGPTRLSSVSGKTIVWWIGRDPSHREFSP